MFWVLIAIFVASMLAGELLRPKPKFNAPHASSLGEFSLPTAEEGRAIPVAFGTCKVSGANVVWYGDLQVIAMTKKVKTGLFSSTTYTTGYKYYLGIQMALSHGTVDQIIEIQVNDKVPTQTVSSISNGTRIAIDAPGFLGGEDQGGGIVGTVDVYFGNNSQTADSYLAQAMAGASTYQSTPGGWQYVTPSPIPIPAYRGICYAAVKSFYVGTSNQVAPIAFVIKRVPNPLGLTGGKHDISGDANPACILYEIFTNALWGLAVPAAQINTAAFVYAANLLFAESTGLSILVDSQKPAIDWIDEICRHIDALIFTDPTTGLLTITLARGDYDINAVPLLNDSSIKNLRFSRSSADNTINTVKLNYIDRAQNFTQRTVQAQNLANIQVSGATSSETIDYPAFSTSQAATLAAARVLKTLSYPLAKMTIKANRSAWKIPPGGVFRLDWPPLGIQGMACRVVRIQYGTITDGMIQIDAAEDIWGTINTAYSAPGSTTWTDPTPDIATLIFNKLIEVPYHYLLNTDHKVMTLACRQNTTVSGYTVWTDKTGGTAYVQTNTVNSFNPSVSLLSDLPKKDSPYLAGGITVQTGPDSNFIESCTSDEFTDGVNVLEFDDELIAFQNVTDNGDGTYTLSPVWRAVLDTVPQDHSAGIVGAHMQGSGLVQNTAFAGDVTLRCKLLTFNGRESYPLGLTSAITLQTASRAASPYPPGNVKINGVWYPDTTTGDTVATWNHRARLSQPKLLRQDDADVSGGPEGTVMVNVYVNGIPKRTFAGITIKTQTYTAAQRIADNSDGSLTTTLEIVPVNGSLTGTKRQMDFVMTGLGMTFGMYLGGIQG